MTARRAYRTDLSDARWALIEPILTAWRAARRGLGITEPTHELREIVNAILSVNRTGIAWEYLPHDSRRPRPSTPISRPGKPTAPPKRSTICSAAGCVSRQDAPPSQPRR